MLPQIILYLSLPPSSPVVWSVGSVISNECLAPFSHPTKRSTTNARPIIKACMAFSVVWIFFLAFLLLWKSFKVLNFIFNPRYFFFKNCNIRLKADCRRERPARERDENSQECSNNLIIHISYNYLCLSLMVLL